MDKIALIETTPSSTDFHKWFEFDFDRFALCSDSSKKKILKRDVDIEIDIDEFEIVLIISSNDSTVVYKGLYFKHFFVSLIFNVIGVIV